MMKNETFGLIFNHRAFMSRLQIPNHLLACKSWWAISSWLLPPFCFACLRFSSQECPVGKKRENFVLEHHLLQGRYWSVDKRLKLLSSSKKRRSWLFDDFVCNKGERKWRFGWKRSSILARKMCMTLWWWSKIRLVLNSQMNSGFGMETKNEIKMGLFSYPLF